MADTSSPSLVPLDDEKKRYQIVKQSNVPPQIYIGEDDVVSTLPIPFVFVQEVENSPSGAGPPKGS
jgi:hypothetical protein